MISVLISVAFMAAEPADLLRRGNSCSSGSCSVSVTKEVTTTKKVETKLATMQENLSCDPIAF